LNFESFSLKHLKVPCEQQELPETEYEFGEVIEEVIVVSE